MNTDQLKDAMAQIFRVGFVTARKPEAHRVQVRLPDTTTQALTSDWLPVLVPRASADLAFDLPDIGDQVLCAFLPYGHEQGFVLGSMYGRQTPPVADAEKQHRTYKDGTTMEYDRAAHKLAHEIKGDVEIHATGQITLKADGEFIIQGKNVRIN